MLKSGRTSRQALDHWARQYSAGVSFYCAGPCFDTDVEPRRRHQIAGDSFLKLIPDLFDRCSLRLLLETPSHWRLRQGIAADRDLWLLGHVQIVTTSARIEEIQREACPFYIGEITEVEFAFLFECVLCIFQVPIPL